MRIGSNEIENSSKIKNSSDQSIFNSRTSDWFKLQKYVFSCGNPWKNFFAQSWFTQMKCWKYLENRINRVFLGVIHRLRQDFQYKK